MTSPDIETKMSNYPMDYIYEKTMLNGTFLVQPPKAPLISLNFGGAEVGKLECKDGRLTFTGNADASAQIFMEHVVERYDATILELRKQIADMTATLRALSKQGDRTDG